MPDCGHCVTLGYCRYQRIKRVSNRELSTPEFVRDLRNYAAGLKISSWVWRDYLIDSYRDLRREIVHEVTRKPIFLDLDAFEEDDYRQWFRDFCSPVSDSNAHPYITVLTWERARVLATILRALDPAGTAMWGIRAANDNEPGT